MASERQTRTDRALQEAMVESLDFFFNVINLDKKREFQINCEGRKISSQTFKGGKIWIFTG